MMSLEGPDTAYDRHYHTRHITMCSQHHPWSHRYDNDNSNTCVVMACHCSKDILESSSLLRHSSVSHREPWGALFQTSHPETLSHTRQLSQAQFYKYKTTQRSGITCTALVIHLITHIKSM